MGTKHDDTFPKSKGIFDSIIQFSIQNALWVILFTLIWIAIGIFSYQRLSIDAVPDITNVQVQINSEAKGFTALETEQRITYPIENEMAGIPNLQQTRSISRYGLSQITVIFKDGTDIYWARQQITERLNKVRGEMPLSVEPKISPPSTGLGEIYQWVIHADTNAKKPDGSVYSPMDLREIQDWIVKPQIQRLSGIAEVNSIGGNDKNYIVSPNLSRLQQLGISLNQITEVLEQNNENKGAGFVENNGQQLTVRVPGILKTVSDIENVVVQNKGNTPIRILDIATVSIGHDLRTGGATYNGKEAVLGIAMMMMGENSRTVAQTVNKKVQEIQRTLPKGVVIETVYDRTNLVDKAIKTVAKNLIEGAVLVIVILFIFLGNLRAALITACIIPLSMLFTLTGMAEQKISANLMSLGALDFGIIIDGAVVIIENCIRRLANAQHEKGRLLTRKERFREVFLAAQQARRPLIFGQLIIMVVYIPIFALTGVEAKLFHPMAMTVVLALVGAMILSLTFVPAAVALCVTGKVSEKESRWMIKLKEIYLLVLDIAYAYKAILIAGVISILCITGTIAFKMGTEFTPKLSEGDFAIQFMRAPSTGIEQSLQMQEKVEQQLIQNFPEVKAIFARTGTAEVATDVMPPNISDSIVLLKPQAEWSNPKETISDLRQRMMAYVEHLPGNANEFSQPIELRFNELISGVRSDIGVKIFGDDLNVLADEAQKVEKRLKTIDGASEVKIEQTQGLPMLNVDIQHDKIAQYGLSTKMIQDWVAMAIGGQSVGKILQGDRRFDFVVRLSPTLNSLEQLQQLPISLPSGGSIVLKDIAKVEEVSGISQISREEGKRRIVITANVRNRDLGSFVKEVQQVMQQQKLPVGYWMSYGGQFENLQSAAQRMQIVVPIALILIFVLLVAVFGRLQESLLVFMGVPFALSGGIVALWLRDIPFSMSAGVGFIALSGVAVLNGLVMLTFIKELAQSHSLVQAIWQGAILRLRPVLMTACVASLGFVPMALATGTGAEVQQPLATVVIGGIVSSTLLTLIVVPIVYRWWNERKS
ncbi:efflux RND transporter permease subunit [Acinetobacter nectaris]|uniref:efflux RND transporter permease subunit n=1 Tax=Acinetobacter nectaris TaxID=1219382 RepID=UPI001EFFF35A|nr:CusA/CzcA family heavy metal efflux RND transporter [Acinetobacter nectaris]MCF9000008.1 CusA/CzcA family heavy metal efflux RND transporter [Acinetobacter nectaris]MCF9028389.1 CusA/CzcA family heavy metal efflux RND transporter [Acinetobacter nectaris]